MHSTLFHSSSARKHVPVPSDACKCHYSTVFYRWSTSRLRPWSCMLWASTSQHRCQTPGCIPTPATLQFSKVSARAARLFPSLSISFLAAQLCWSLSLWANSAEIYSFKLRLNENQPNNQKASKNCRPTKTRISPPQSLHCLKLSLIRKIIKMLQWKNEM